MILNITENEASMIAVVMSTAFECDQLEEINAARGDWMRVDVSRLMRKIAKLDEGVGDLITENLRARTTQ